MLEVLTLGRSGWGGGGGGAGCCCCWIGQKGVDLKVRRDRGPEGREQVSLGVRWESIEEEGLSLRRELLGGILSVRRNCIVEVSTA